MKTALLILALALVSMNAFADNGVIVQPNPQDGEMLRNKALKLDENPIFVPVKVADDYLLTQFVDLGNGDTAVFYATKDNLCLARMFKDGSHDLQCTPLVRP